MKKKNFLVTTAIALAGAVVLLAGVRTCVFAQVPTPPPWRYEWTAPTTGSPVVKYAVEISVNGAVVDTVFVVGTTQVEIDVQYGNDYSVRVAGIDAANRWGPWSAPSVLETAEEAPPTNTSEAK